MSQTVCSRCGTLNTAGARFCAKCGSPIVAVAPPQTPAMPYQGAGTGMQPPPVYDYAAAMVAQNRTTEIDRTKTGLLLLLIGIILTPVPIAGFIGDILILIGAILVIVGRKAFGAAHARNTIWSIIIFAIGIGVIIAGAVAFGIAVASATITNAQGGTVNTAALIQSLQSSFYILLIFSAVGGAIFGIAEVLFTYAIQNQTGKILLWTGYAAALAIAIVNFLIISPLIANAAAESVAGGTYNPVPLSNLQSQLQTLGLLAFIPAIIYATAIYLAWSRVKRREVPGPAQPTTTMGAPYGPGFQGPTQVIA